MAYLLESNILGILAEALSAHVESVFTDQTMAVTTHTAENIPTKNNVTCAKSYTDNEISFFQNSSSHISRGFAYQRIAYLVQCP